jgi:hypothetical protein
VQETLVELAKLVGRCLAARWLRTHPPLKHLREEESSQQSIDCQSSRAPSAVEGRIGRQHGDQQNS